MLGEQASEAIERGGQVAVTHGFDAASDLRLVLRRVRVIGAVERLTDLEGAPVRAGQRAWIEGWIAYARGQDREAIRLFERGISLLGPRSIQRVFLEIELVNLYVRAGDVGHARSLRAQFAPPRAEGELLTLAIAGADLSLAIAEGRERELAEEELQRWISLALAGSHTTLILAALARVLAARGDDDLADHLAREARDRFSWCPLECTPALARWIDERVARAPDEKDR